ncbi:MAG: hypothetical protein ABI644_01340 [Arenimonas sp.]
MNRILILFLISILLWTCSKQCAAEKTTQSKEVGVVFEIDAAGQVKSVNAVVHANQMLSPLLFEKFRSRQFPSRYRNGIAVPAKLHGLVLIQAITSRNGQVRMVFQEPKWQAVRVGGEKLDFAVIQKLISNTKLEYRVNIKIKADGTVSDVQVTSNSRKVDSETIEMIRNSILTWRYAVDVEDGIPHAMTVETKIGLGYRPNTNILENDWRAPIQIGPMHK